MADAFPEEEEVDYGYLVGDELIDSHFAPAVLGGVVQDAEDAAAALSEGKPIPVGTVPGSRLSVIFNSGPVQAALFRYLDKDSILNVMQSDPYARYKILGHLRDRGPDFEYPRGHVPGSDRARDYNWAGVGCESVKYAINPPAGLCSVDHFGPPSFRETVSSGLPGLPKTAVAHRRERMKVTEAMSSNDPNRRISAPALNQDYEREPWYKPGFWMKCRYRSRHLNHEAACSICFADSIEKAYFNPDQSLPYFLPVCGLCHQEATKKYPWGYGPRSEAVQVGDRHDDVFSYLGPNDGSLYRNCECLEDMRDATCFPCFDRLLDKRAKTSNIHSWPKPVQAERRHWARADRNLRIVRQKPRGVNETQWPICPCGREINPIKHPLHYSAWLFLHVDAEDEEYEDAAPNMDNLESFDWTAVCVDCNGLWVPPTSEESEPEINSPKRVPFKQALNIGGKENNWRVKPNVNAPVVRIDGKPRKVAQSVVDSREYYNKVQYRVIWAGLNNGEVDLKWYKTEDLDHFPDLVRQFHAQNPDKPRPTNKRKRKA